MHFHLVFFKLFSHTTRLLRFWTPCSSAVSEGMLPHSLYGACGIWPVPFASVQIFLALFSVKTYIIIYCMLMPLTFS